MPILGFWGKGVKSLIQGYQIFTSLLIDTEEKTLSVPAVERCHLITRNLWKKPRICENTIHDVEMSKILRHVTCPLLNLEFVQNNQHFQ